MYVSFACMYVCTYICMFIMSRPIAPKGQKRASDALELELQLVVSLPVGAGNSAWVFCKRSKC